MRIVATAMAALAVGALWCGAAAAEEPGLVGTWTVKTEQAQIESTYSADGSYVCKVAPAGGQERLIRGKYKVAGGALEVQIDGRDKPTQYKWRLVDSLTLELTDSVGNSTRQARRAEEKPASPLVGEWVLKNAQLEFHLKLSADGTFDRVTKTAAGEQKVRGKYRVDGEKLELRPDDGGAFSFKQSLKDASNLVLTADDGSSLHVVRVGQPPEGPVRVDPLFGPAYGPAFRPAAQAAPPAYLKGVAPDLTKLGKSATGHILYSHVEMIEVPILKTALPAAKTYIMTGDGEGQARFISPDGASFVWSPSWSSDGKRIAFASNFESARSAMYIDAFVADLAGGVRRVTGVEAWAPVKGRGTLTVHVEADVTGQGAPSNTGQINIAVQTCDGKLFHLQGERKKEPGQLFPVFTCRIPDCPSGTIWVKAWMNRFIGDVTTVVLPTDGAEEVLLKLSRGNYMATQPQVTPDGKLLVYTTETTSFARVAQADWSNPKGAPPGNPYQGYSTLAVFDIARGVPLVNWPGDQLGTAVEPKLSPDGQWIAFTLGTLPKQMIAVMSLQGFLAGRPDAKVLVRGDSFASPLDAGGVGNCQPAWSPDGKRLVFVRHTMGTKAYFGNLAVVNADGTGLAQLTNLAANQLPAWPTWSPDGRRIAFQLRTGKGPVIDPIDVEFLGATSDIWSISADGKDPRQLTKDGRSGEPSWGP